MQNDIANWYMEQEINNIKTEEDIIKMSKIVNSVIQRMIVQERTLLIVKDDTDYKMRILQLHPNYIV